jgi:hypothetical protein
MSRQGRRSSRSACGNNPDQLLKYAAVATSEPDRRRAFPDAALVLRRRIELFVSLPLDKLTRLALQARLDDIGRASSAGESGPLSA